MFGMTYVLINQRAIEFQSQYAQDAFDDSRPQKYWKVAEYHATKAQRDPYNNVGPS